MKSVRNSAPCGHPEDAFEAPDLFGRKFIFIQFKAQVDLSEERKGYEFFMYMFLPPPAGLQKQVPAICRP
jgi:hypothetical protein